MKTVTVYMMIGLPGAGKNTWIDKNLPSTVKQVSRDDIRVELGYCTPDEKIVGTSQQEAMVSDVFNKKLVSYVKDGHDVVINNINLKKKYRDGYKKLLNKYKIKWVYVVVEAPTIEENISRRERQVPEDVLRKMYETFTMPQSGEYDEIIHYKQIKV
jgi:predicted kinase